MIEKTDKIETLIARIEERENHSKKRVVLWTAIPLLSVLVALIFAWYQRDNAQEVLMAFNPILRNFGWSSERVPIAKPSFIKQSLKADEELKQLLAQQHQTE